MLSFGLSPLELLFQFIIIIIIIINFAFIEEVIS